MTSSPYSINRRAVGISQQPHTHIHTHRQSSVAICFNLAAVTLSLSLSLQAQANNANGNEWLWAFSHWLPAVSLMHRNTPEHTPSWWDGGRGGESGRVLPVCVRAKHSPVLSLFRKLTFHRHICLVNDVRYLPEIQNRDVSKLIKVMHIRIIMQLGADGIVTALHANDKVNGRMRDLEGPREPSLPALLCNSLPNWDEQTLALMINSQKTAN